MSGYPQPEFLTEIPSNGDGNQPITTPPRRLQHGSNPDMWLYRERTVALLRRYLRISIEVGRLPSIFGRELFRSKVTSYRMSSFEDGVIFVHDVEQALDQLQLFPRRIMQLCCSRNIPMRKLPRFCIAGGERLPVNFRCVGSD